jgi:Domain of Unknown Function with PDB structure (DUF3857)/Transglutaminase-like superfamily
MSRWSDRHLCALRAAPRRWACVVAVVAVAAAAAAPVPGVATDFPPLTDQERALTAVPGQPNAPAVVLFKKGELRMMNPASSQDSSYLVVEERVKILTDAGRSRGNVLVAHNGTFRLEGFEGRTVLPDGSIVPLPKDVQFRNVTSRLHKHSVTAVAFPGVVAGAILDYHYAIRWDSFIFLEPWIFQDRIPVLHSEITYLIPPTLGVKAWRSDPMQVGIHSETAAERGSQRLRAWADNLPGVPEEAFSLPFTEMAAEEMVLPTEIARSGTRLVPLFEDWASTCKLYDAFYQAAKRRDGDATRQAGEIAARAASALPGGDASLERRQAAAIYDFVRDEIATVHSNRVVVPRDAGVGAVLAARRGEPAEKALLLQVMLAAVKIDSRLVWAANREDGAIHLEIPNPAWFDRVLVAAQVDGRRVYLDPSDRSLCFGHVEPGYEGTQAVLYDRDKPEVITLPETPFEQNVRRAKLDLTLDDTGRATGTGTLTLLGHPAWQRTRWKGPAADATASWQERLRKDFPAYEISGVTVTENLDEPQVTVRWALAQNADEALGDQTTLVPSRPLGPQRQPFPIGAKRLSAVEFPFAERTEVELTLHWAAGWRPEVLPAASHYQTFAGAIFTSVDVDAANRTLTYHRRFDEAHWKMVSAEQFAMVQQLFEEAQKIDAQSLVLARH